MHNIKDDKEALTHALILAVTAPTDKLQEVVKIADEIASRLSEKDIEACKQETMAWIDAREELAKLSEDEIH
ncbi:MAG: hypothetical protein WCK90_05325 [archaeon]